MVTPTPSTGASVPSATANMWGLRTGWTERRGERSGCAFHWRYSRDAPQKDGSTTRLAFNDWFYRIDDRVVMVKGTAGRLGLPFATAHVLYRRLDD